jgi:TPR repeat protein
MQPGTSDPLWCFVYEAADGRPPFFGGYLSSDDTHHNYGNAPADMTIESFARRAIAHAARQLGITRFDFQGDERIWTRPVRPNTEGTDGAPQPNSRATEPTALASNPADLVRSVAAAAAPPPQKRSFWQRIFYKQPDAQRWHSKWRGGTHPEGTPLDAVVVEWYREATERNSVEAQLKLGHAHYTGETVRKDYVEAVKWFRKAAEQGHADGQLKVGAAYALGVGVRKDLAQAARWFRKAAEQGHAEAQVHLGTAYFVGDGVPEDFVEAVKWYRMAADQGNVKAQFFLADAYYTGIGVEMNDAEAMKWYRKAASQGHAESARKLREMEREQRSESIFDAVSDESSLPSLRWIDTQFTKARQQGDEQFDRLIEAVEMGDGAAICGKLAEIYGPPCAVQFLDGPHRAKSIIVFNDGTGVRVGGDSYIPILTFGYTGQGERAFNAFLGAAEFPDPDVASIEAPLMLCKNGHQMNGVRENQYVRWEDGSTSLVWQDPLD